MKQLFIFLTFLNYFYCISQNEDKPPYWINPKISLDSIASIKENQEKNKSKFFVYKDVEEFNFKSNKKSNKKSNNFNARRRSKSTRF